jgi:hypothetical protein
MVFDIDNLSLARQPAGPGQGQGRKGGSPNVVKRPGARLVRIEAFAIDGIGFSKPGKSAGEKAH